MSGVALLAGVLAIVVVPVVLARLVLGRADLAALYRAPGDDWARGVQEEDCPRWRVTIPCVAESGRATAAPGEEVAASAGEVAATGIQACMPANTAAAAPSSGEPGRCGAVQPRVPVRGRIRRGRAA